MTQFKEKSEEQDFVSSGALQLPRADGRRHPALPDRHRPDRRRPAPAPRARAQHRRALQRPLRRDVQGARRRLPRGGRADQEPAGAGAADVDDARRAAGRRPADRPARRDPQEVQDRGHRLGHRGAPRSRGQAGRLEPDRDHGRRHRRARSPRSRRSSTARATARSRRASPRPWSSCSRRSRSATTSSARTRASCGGCSRRAPTRPARRARRRSRRCTSAWALSGLSGRTAALFAGILALCVVTGVLHYADAEPVAIFLARGRGAGRARLGDRRRDRVGRRALRPGADRRAAVDARQPARALRRPLRALGRRDRRRADVDPRLAVRERAARARPRDRRGLARPRGRRHALPDAAAERHGDAAAAGRLHHRPARALGHASATGRASTRSRSRSSARSACSPSTASGSGRTCASDRGEPALEEARARAVLVRDRRSSCSRSPASAPAFVSDWFVDALDPAVEALGISKAFTGHRDRRDRRQRGREHRRDHARREGPVRPRDLGGQELGRADRRVPLPRARPALALLRAPADVRPHARLHRRARADGDRGLADHRRRRGRAPSRASRSSRSTSCSRRSRSTSRARGATRPPPSVSSRQRPGSRPVDRRAPRSGCGAGGAPGGRPPRASA